MRLRICWYCGEEDNDNISRSTKRRGNTIEMQTGPPLTQQPSRTESIDVRKIAEFSRQISTEMQEPVTESSNIRESSFTSSSSTPGTKFTTLSNLPLTNLHSTVSATSNFNYIAKNGEQTKMTFDQVEPGHFRGTYKGSEFTVFNGRLQSKDGAFSQLDQEVILENYSQATLAMHQGVLGMEARLLNSLNCKPPSLRQLTQLTIPGGSKINVNFTAENGEKFKMTFKQIKPGLVRGTCNEKQFSIANGQVFTLDGAKYDLKKELVLSTFYRAMLGVQQTKLGLQQGEWAAEARLSGNQLNPIELLKAACPERRAQFETESLKVHNELRQIHGVPPLTHSEFLSEMAREWAEHLALKDTSYKRPNTEYGENLYYSHGVTLDARKAVTTWYDEINLYNYDDPQFSKDTGHFTQLVWKDTKEMGTGIAQLGDKMWVCCYYHPAGNIESKFGENHVPRPKQATEVT